MVWRPYIAWYQTFPYTFVIKCIPWVACLCLQVSFKQAFNVGKISEYPPGYRGLGHVDVQCFPLYSYLLALNRTKIDYFSLDVEGSELDVLRTIPFEKLDIQVSVFSPPLFSFLLFLIPPSCRCLTIHICYGVNLMHACFHVELYLSSHNSVTWALSVFLLGKVMAVLVMVGSNVVWLCDLGKHSFVFYCVKLVLCTAESVILFHHTLHLLQVNFSLLKRNYQWWICYISNA
jgi:hypothetical protein